MDVTSQKTKEQNLKRENRALGRDKPESDGFGRIVGKSSAMQRVYDLMRKAAKSDTSVILYGETGVGKDLAAQAIHELSGCKGRFIPVNCAAIPEHLLESEFFGHVKGAFSGAVTNRPGYLAAADKGTLFLDEIAELPLHLQVKLLRALESKTFTPVGSNEVRSSDFRLISATNRDLAAMVRQKNLRADFFYRIHVLTIIIPPLRERKADIPLLAHSYARYKGITQPLPDSLLARLETHPWAGNVRELHNALERYWTFGMQGFEDLAACPDIFSAGAQTVSPETLPAGRETRPRPAETGTSAFSSSLADSTPRQDSPAVAVQSGDVAPAASSLGMARDELEQRRILAALDEQGWKKGKTAQTLGVTMRTLQRKLKKYGLSHRKNQGIH
jgi:transcriptional regulator with PAS, ATPase and Fis domain